MRSIRLAYAWLLISLASLSVAAQSPTFFLSPAVITDCEGIHGMTTVVWNGSPNRVQIRVGSPDGPGMTGYGPGEGFASTGTWVSEGLTFFLVNEANEVEATAAASVACGQGVGQPEIGEPSTSYFPLTVGNRWIYRKNSRFVTSGYVTWEIVGTTGDFVQYHVLRMSDGDQETELLLREGEDGRIWQFVSAEGEGAGTESIFLDPGLQAVQAYETPLAKFAETVHPVTLTTLNRTTQVFARSVGMVFTETFLLTGSSGGFVESLELIDVDLPGRLDLELPAMQSLSLSVEQTRLDVSSGNLFNCAVPSYAVMGGNPDPPGTYKPCVRVKVSGSGNERTIAVFLMRDFVTLVHLDEVLSETRVDLPSTFLIPIYQKTFVPSEAGAWTHYFQLPLYDDANITLPPGTYRLIAVGIDPEEPMSSFSAPSTVQAAVRLKVK